MQKHEHIYDMREIGDEEIFRLGESLDLDYIVSGEFSQGEPGLLDIVVRVSDIKQHGLFMESKYSVRTTEMPSFARNISEKIVSSMVPASHERPPPAGDINENAVRENAIGYMKMVESTLSQKSHADPVRHFRRATDISPDYKNAWGNMGWAYYAKGKYEKALKAFKRAHELDKKMVDSVAGIGLAYIRMKKTGQGLDHLQEARAMHPNLQWLSAAYRDEATRLMTPEAIPHLMNLLGSDDLEDQEEARKALDRFKFKRRDLKLLFPFLNSPNAPARQYSIIKALTLCNTRCRPVLSRHLDAITPVASHDSPSIRHSAVVALGEVGTEAESDVLWNRYHIDPYDKVRLRALVSLCFIGDKKAAGVLANELRSLEAPKLRNSLMRSLSRGKDRITDPALLELIKNYKDRKRKQ
jgi:hypothetical protein